MRGVIRFVTAIFSSIIFFISTVPVFAEIKNDDNSSGMTTACFTDVRNNAYYYQSVYWAKVMGIASGTSDVTFSPNQICTRAEMVTFLARVEGGASEDTNTPFEDVPATAYYASAVARLADGWLIRGTSPTTFSPDAPCTRGQIAAVLYRYCCTVQTPNGPAIGYIHGIPASVTTYFNDVPDDSSYAEAISWIKEQGIASGTSENTFSPNEPCTRGQIVTFIWRLMGCPEVNIVDPVTQPERSVGNEKYGHWETRSCYACNGCGKHFWDINDYSYSSWIGNSTHDFHDHGSQTSVTSYDFWVWDDIPRMEDPNSGKPFYSEEDWNSYIQFLHWSDQIAEEYNLPVYEEDANYEKQCYAMSWEKDAIPASK